MKRLAVLVMVLLLLCGCGTEDQKMDRALALRQRLLEGSGCSFETIVSADYGEYLHSFVLRCQADTDGKITFEVLAPETIRGITGTMNAEQGTLTFDQEILAFSPLADGQIAPVTAPWILVHTLRGGYISACGETEQGLLLSVNDSYADDALGLEIRLDENDLPVSAEIIWQGRRILSMLIEDFEIL